MADTAVPHFFEQFQMQRVDSATLDEVLREHAAPLSVLFLWGRDCPNCDIAKRAMLLARERLQWPQVRWLHDNVYDDPAMATRFGLHGIPAFFVFRGERKIGRITAWPGAPAFIERLRSRSHFLQACRKAEQNPACTLNSHGITHTNHTYRRDGDQKWRSNIVSLRGWPFLPRRPPDKPHQSSPG